MASYKVRQIRDTKGASIGHKGFLIALAKVTGQPSGEDRNLSAP